MLVLTRRQGESITIGKDIKITYLKRNQWDGKEGNSVVLGIEAPKHMVVDRTENRVKDQNRRLKDE